MASFSLYSTQSCCTLSSSSSANEASSVEMGDEAKNENSTEVLLLRLIRCADIILPSFLFIPLIMPTLNTVGRDVVVLMDRVDSVELNETLFRGVKDCSFSSSSSNCMVDEKHRLFIATVRRAVALLTAVNNRIEESIPCNTFSSS